jgi:hypothetical protein
MRLKALLLAALLALAPTGASALPFGPLGQQDPGEIYTPGPPGPGGPHALNDHTDVTITTPTVKDHLRFNGSLWVNAPIPEGDLPSTVITETDLPTCNVGTEVLFSDGTTITCVPDVGGAGSGTNFDIKAGAIIRTVNNTEEIELIGGTGITVVLAADGSDHDFTFAYDDAVIASQSEFDTHEADSNVHHAQFSPSANPNTDHTLFDAYVAGSSAVTPNTLHRLDDTGNPHETAEGPSSATDGAIARWDGTTGNLLQDSNCDFSGLGGYLQCDQDATSGHGVTLREHIAQGTNKWQLVIPGSGLDIDYACAISTDGRIPTYCLQVPNASGVVWDPAEADWSSTTVEVGLNDYQRRFRQQKVQNVALTNGYCKVNYGVTEGDEQPLECWFDSLNCSPTCVELEDFHNDAQAVRQTYGTGYTQAGIRIHLPSDIITLDLLDGGALELDESRTELVLHETILRTTDGVPATDTASTGDFDLDSRLVLNVSPAPGSNWGEGDIMKGPDNRWYMIEATSGSTVTLLSPYEGADSNGAAITVSTGKLISIANHFISITGTGELQCSGACYSDTGISGVDGDRTIPAVALEITGAQSTYIGPGIVVRAWNHKDDHAIAIVNASYWSTVQASPIYAYNGYLMQYMRDGLENSACLTGSQNPYDCCSGLGAGSCDTDPRHPNGNGSCWTVTTAGIFIAPGLSAGACNTVLTVGNGSSQFLDGRGKLENSGRLLWAPHGTSGVTIRNIASEQDMQLDAVTTDDQDKEWWIDIDPDNLHGAGTSVVHLDLGRISFSGETGHERSFLRVGDDDARVTLSGFLTNVEDLLSVHANTDLQGSIYCDTFTSTACDDVIAVGSAASGYSSYCVNGNCFTRTLGLNTLDLGDGSGSVTQKFLVSGTDPYWVASNGILNLVDGTLRVDDDDVCVDTGGGCGSGHAAVTLAGTLDYLTLSGQEITRGPIDLQTDVTNTLLVGNGGTGGTTFTQGNLILGNVAAAFQSFGCGIAGQYPAYDCGTGSCSDGDEGWTCGTIGPATHIDSDGDTNPELWVEDPNDLIAYDFNSDGTADAGIGMDPRGQTIRNGDCRWKGPKATAQVIACYFDGTKCIGSCNDELRAFVWDAGLLRREWGTNNVGPGIELHLPAGDIALDWGDEAGATEAERPISINEARMHLVFHGTRILVTDSVPTTTTVASCTFTEDSTTVTTATTPLTNIQEGDYVQGPDEAWYLVCGVDDSSNAIYLCYPYEDTTDTITATFSTGKLFVLEGDKWYTSIRGNGFIYCSGACRSYQLMTSGGSRLIPARVIDQVAEFSSVLDIEIRSFNHKDDICVLAHGDDDMLGEQNSGRIWKDITAGCSPAEGGYETSQYLRDGTETQHCVDTQDPYDCCSGDQTGTCETFDDELLPQPHGACYVALTGGTHIHPKAGSCVGAGIAFLHAGSTPSNVFDCSVGCENVGRLVWAPRGFDGLTVYMGDNEQVMGYSSLAYNDQDVHPWIDLVGNDTQDFARLEITKANFTSEVGGERPFLRTQGTTNIQVYLDAAVDDTSDLLDISATTRLFGSMICEPGDLADSVCDLEASVGHGESNYSINANTFRGTNRFTPSVIYGGLSDSPIVSYADVHVNAELWIVFANALAGQDPYITSTGGTDVDLDLRAPGTGVVRADGIEIVVLTGNQTLDDKTMTSMNVGATGWTDANHAHAAVNSGGTIAHSATSGRGVDDHHNEAHQIDDAVHAETGLTIGHVLRATGTSTFGWGALNLDVAAAITGTIPDANVETNLTINQISSGTFDMDRDSPANNEGRLAWNVANYMVVGDDSGVHYFYPICTTANEFRLLNNCVNFDTEVDANSKVTANAAHVASPGHTDCGTGLSGSPGGTCAVNYGTSASTAAEGNVFADHSARHAADSGTDELAANDLGTTCGAGLGMTAATGNILCTDLFTEAEATTHKASGDHDSRYPLKAGETGYAGVHDYETSGAELKLPSVTSNPWSVAADKGKIAIWESGQGAIGWYNFDGSGGDRWINVMREVCAPIINHTGTFTDIKEYPVASWHTGMAWTYGCGCNVRDNAGGSPTAEVKFYDPTTPTLMSTVTCGTGDTVAYGSAFAGNSAAEVVYAEVSASTGGADYIWACCKFIERTP